MKKYSLVLGGGAARGLAHIGIIELLEEKKIQIQEVSGTSMGAIIAAMFAHGKTSEDMKEFAKSINFVKLIDLDFKTGLLKGNKIEKKLEEIFGESKIEDTKIPLKIVATNIEKSIPHTFTSGKITTALRASISLPGVFIPYKINGESYVDGGIMMNLPIEVISGKNIIAISALKINSGPIEKTKRIIGFNFKSGFLKNNFEIFTRSIILMMKSNENSSLKTFNKNIHFLRLNFGNLNLIDFNKVDEFLEIGYQEAKKIEF